MFHPIRLLSLACLTLLSGCFFARERVNHPIDPAAYGKLVPGTSTADDVLRELGAPEDVVQLGKRSAWRYSHSQTKSAAIWPIIIVFSNKETQQDRIWAFFNEKDVLTHIGGTFRADEADYQMPWQD
jgi:outer membrane protein assembly factor BamE (lipoprotein component of BamABCDE complex)